MKKLIVKVKPFSKHESVELLADGSYLVKVNSIPAEGKANTRVIELLASYLNRPKSHIELISGHKSKNKIFALKV